VFGYTACLPQILRQVGVDYFFTTKLTWCSVNRFPYSSFRWQGHDGSEVIAHVTQDFGYNGTTSVGELRAGALAYRQSDVHTQFLAPTGFGDGGGGVTEAMCERARRLSDLAGVPRTRWGKIEDFFAGLEPVRAQLPAWRGELYLEYHRGVMTTHSHAKDAFRGLERALQTHEAVRCAQGGEPLDRHPWERLVFAQFHDYIPGSSIHEVYDEGVAEMRALAGEALAQAAAELGHDGPEALFNPLPVARTVVTERGPVRLAPLAGAPLAELAPVAAEPVRTAPDLLDNGLVRARFDGVGRIVELTVHGQSVAVAAPLGELVVYPDHPHAYPAWDIDRSTLANGVPVTSPTTMVVAAPGVLRCDQALGASSRVSIRYLLEPASPVLRIEYDLDWHDEDTLLKVRFPTAYDGVNARFGHPFGSVLRGQQPGRERDEAQWEVCASRWAAVADDTERDGLMLITEAKYGFTCRQGDLQLSLVRSAYITNEDWHKPIRRTHAEHRVSDIGRHRIRIAVGRYRVDAPREELPATLADTLFTPPLTYRGAALASPLLGLEGGASLVPCWAQPARDGAWVLRLHETLGRREVAQVRLAPGWQAQAVELSGRPTGQTLDNGLSFGPYSLLSLRLAPES
jgi:alpha-mannosidase